MRIGPLGKEGVCRGGGVWGVSRARSPSPERAAVSARPPGGGSPPP